MLLGGYPGEWEGEHPLEVVRETGNPDVFLAGWRGHEDLPAGLNAADLLVLPSVHEQFGRCWWRRWRAACRSWPWTPTALRRSWTPARPGWLVPPDDEDAMVEALVEAVNGDAERRRRGERAYDEARARYAWPALARGLARVYEEVREGRPPAAGAHTLLEG